MSPHNIAFVSSLIVVAILVALIDRLIRPSLRRILEEVTCLPAATDFYLRSLTIVVACVGLSAVVGSPHGDLKDGAHFMEYVWSVAAGLEQVFEGWLAILLVYVALITVLMAALRRKTESR